MPKLRETLQCIALGLLAPALALANPPGDAALDAVPASATAQTFGNYGSARSLLDLPPVLAPSQLPLLVAQAGTPGTGTFFDASQISPLGDRAWVAAMRGPDPSKPVIHTILSGNTIFNSSSQKLEPPSPSILGGDATVRNGQALRNGRVFLIGAERSALTKGGSILLAPGRAAELGDLGVPFVRVYVAAPAGTTLDVEGLVGKRPVIGMFNALFAPLPARRGEIGATAIASLSVPAFAANAVSAGDAVKSAPLPAAPVAVAFAAPMADRSVEMLPIPPASVEDRVLIAYAAPVEDRSGIFATIPPASVEERFIIAYAAPVEDRSGALLPIPPASVEDRLFLAFAAPVEDRSGVVASILPASVEDRSFVAFAAPIEDKAFALRPQVPAPIEERAPDDIGKPLPGPISEARLAAAKEVSGAPATDLVKVAVATPVVVVAADSNVVRRAETSDPAPAPVKLAAIQRRLPNIMIDRRGGYFFM